MFKVKALSCLSDSDMQERIEIKVFIKKANLETESLEELEELFKEFMEEYKARQAELQREKEEGVRRIFISALQ